MKNVKKRKVLIPHVAEKAIDEIFVVSGKPAKNPAAVALGRLGGKKGGKARAERLTPERRLQIATKAAYTRWNKKSE